MLFHIELYYLPHISLIIDNKYIRVIIDVLENEPEIHPKLTTLWGGKKQCFNHIIYKWNDYFLQRGKRGAGATLPQYASV